MEERRPALAVATPAASPPLLPTLARQDSSSLYDPHLLFDPFSHVKTPLASVSVGPLLDEAAFGQLQDAVVRGDVAGARAALSAVSTQLGVAFGGSGLTAAAAAAPLPSPGAHPLLAAVLNRRDAGGRTLAMLAAAVAYAPQLVPAAAAAAAAAAVDPAAVEATVCNLLALLLDAGADVGAVDSEGYTPLHYAAGACGSAAAAAAAVAAAAAASLDAAHAAHGRQHHHQHQQQAPPLVLPALLCTSGFSSATAQQLPPGAARVALLCQRGASVNVRATTTGETPLHRAARAGCAGSVEELLRRGARPRDRSRACLTAWDVAGRPSPADGVHADARDAVAKALAAHDPSLRVSVLSHPDCLAHVTKKGHQEAPERLTAILSRVTDAARFGAHEVDLRNRDEDVPLATDTALLRAHSGEYVKLVRALARHVTSAAQARERAKAAAAASKARRASAAAGALGAGATASGGVANDTPVSSSSDDSGTVGGGGGEDTDGTGQSGRHRAHSSSSVGLPLTRASTSSNEGASSGRPEGLAPIRAPASGAVVSAASSARPTPVAGGGVPSSSTALVPAGSYTLDDDTLAVPFTPMVQRGMINLLKLQQIHHLQQLHQQQQQMAAAAAAAAARSGHGVHHHAHHGHSHHHGHHHLPLGPGPAGRRRIKDGRHSDTSFSLGSLPAALRAAGAVCAAVDTVAAGRSRHALCLVRPPGHHSGVNGLLTDLASSPSCGFCIWNNVAIGALHALASHPGVIRRVAIVDIDVHHGNGTEEIVRRWAEAQRSGDGGAPGQALFFFSAHLFDVERRKDGGEAGAPGAGGGDGDDGAGGKAPVKMQTRRRTGGGGKGADGGGAWDGGGGAGGGGDAVGAATAAASLDGHVSDTGSAGRPPAAKRIRFKTASGLSLAAASDGGTIADGAASSAGANDEAAAAGAAGSASAKRSSLGPRGGRTSRRTGPRGTSAPTSLATSRGDTADGDGDDGGAGLSPPATVEVPLNVVFVPGSDAPVLCTLTASGPPISSTIDGIDSGADSPVAPSTPQPAAFRVARAMVTALGVPMTAPASLQSPPPASSAADGTTPSSADSTGGFSRGGAAATAAGGSGGGGALPVGMMGLLADAAAHVNDGSSNPHATRHRLTSPTAASGHRLRSLQPQVTTVRIRRGPQRAAAAAAAAAAADELSAGGVLSEDAEMAGADGVDAARAPSPTSDTMTMDDEEMSAPTAAAAATGQGGGATDGEDDGASGAPAPVKRKRSASISSASTGTSLSSSGAAVVAHQAGGNGGGARRGRRAVSAASASKGRRRYHFSGDDSAQQQLAAVTDDEAASTAAPAAAPLMAPVGDGSGVSGTITGVKLRVKRGGGAVSATAASAAASLPPVVTGDESAAAGGGVVDPLAAAAAVPVEELDTETALALHVGAGGVSLTPHHGPGAALRSPAFAGGGLGGRHLGGRSGGATPGGFAAAPAGSAAAAAAAATAAAAAALQAAMRIGISRNDSVGGFGDVVVPTGPSLAPLPSPALPPGDARTRAAGTAGAAAVASAAAPAGGADTPATTDASSASSVSPLAPRHPPAGSASSADEGSGASASSSASSSPGRMPAGSGATAAYGRSLGGIVPSSSPAAHFSPSDSVFLRTSAQLRAEAAAAAAAASGGAAIGTALQAPEASARESPALPLGSPPTVARAGGDASSAAASTDPMSAATSGPSLGMQVLVAGSGSSGAAFAAAPPGGVHSSTTYVPLARFSSVDSAGDAARQQQRRAAAAARGESDASDGEGAGKRTALQHRPGSSTVAATRSDGGGSDDDDGDDEDIVYAFYPGSGGGDALEANVINAPIPPLWRVRPEHRARQRQADKATAGRLVLRRTIAQRLVPALRAFGPDLILISAGFDACAGDVGNTKSDARASQGMNLTPEDYAYITSAVCAVARVCCPGRVVSVLEGGYGTWKWERVPVTAEEAAAAAAAAAGGGATGGGASGAGAGGGISGAAPPAAGTAGGEDGAGGDDTAAGTASAGGASSHAVAPTAAVAESATSSSSSAASAAAAAPTTVLRPYLDRSNLAECCAAHLRALIDDGARWGLDATGGEGGAAAGGAGGGVE